MRKILSACAVCLLLAAAAHAESLIIGDESVGYTVPQGYLTGNNEFYLGMRKLIAEASPKNFQVLALYVDEKSHKKSMTSGFLERYFVIATLRQFADKSLSAKDFVEIKANFVERQEQVAATLKKKLNQTLGEVGEGRVSVGGIDSLGVFDSSDTGFSCLLVMEQVADFGGRREKFKQAGISSCLLARGKMVIVNQYQLLDPAQDMAGQLSAAKEHAREILKELKIRQGVPWTSHLDSFVVRVALVAVIGGIVGGLMGWLVSRRRKKKTGAA